MFMAKEYQKVFSMSDVRLVPAAWVKTQAIDKQMRPRVTIRGRFASTDLGPAHSLWAPVAAPYKKTLGKCAYPSRPRISDPLAVFISRTQPDATKFHKEVDDAYHRNPRWYNRRIQFIHLKNGGWKLLPEQPQTGNQEDKYGKQPLLEYDSF